MSGFDENRREAAVSLLAAIVESSQDAIVSKTLGGIVTSWNRAAEQIFGYAAKEMVGQSLSLLLPPGRGDELAQILDRIRRGERLERYQTERRRKDGKIIAVEMTVSPIRDSAGHIVGASKIARDITQTRRAADALAASEAQLRSILDTVPDAMIVIDENGVIQSFSAEAERMFGYAAAEVRGQNVSMLMPPPYRDGHDGYLARYRATGERRIIGQTRVVAARRKDGTILPIELSVGEAKGPDHRLFTGFLRDLTERQTTLRRLQELQSELSHVTRLTEMGQMATELAHEVNQPLTAAVNYLEATRRLLARPDDEARQRAMGAIDNALAQTVRVADLVRRLRSFARKSEVLRRPEELRQIIEEASAIALIGAKENGVRVRLDCPPALPMVSVDKVQVQQVMINLIRNAVEAMAASERRELNLSAIRETDGAVAVRVADSGPGIAPEIADRLFQPFVTTKPQGIGVGLSICRSIVEAHGGQLRYQPNPEGGAAFSFSLPVAAEREPDVAPGPRS
jgi:two-component system sensor kinase FixL